ncbi:12466_t:CDS:2, partial [Cetraspora pellucida]
MSEDNHDQNNYDQDNYNQDNYDQDNYDQDNYDQNYHDEDSHDQDTANARSSEDSASTLLVPEVSESSTTNPAVCNYCKYQLSHKKGTGMFHLHRHLKSCKKYQKLVPKDGSAELPK